MRTLITSRPNLPAMADSSLNHHLRFCASVDYWLVALAGLWLTVSPWIFHYSTVRFHALSDCVSGALLVLLAPAALLTARRVHWLGWLCAGIGAWVLLSLLMHRGVIIPAAALWNRALVGAVVFELAGWATDAACRADIRLRWQ